MNDVAREAILMAERAFKQRDEAVKALEGMLHLVRKEAWNAEGLPEVVAARRIISMVKGPGHG